ncbi:MAG: EB domain-containing protein [Flavobacteriales bacterium]
MKHTFLNLLLLFFACTTIIPIGCKEKCKNCPSGSECLDGTCICQPGRFSFNGSCVQMGDDSYVGINQSCYCYDTLAISIAGEGEFRSIAMPIKYGDQVGSLSQGIFYYEMANGDSLYSPQLDLRCFDANDTPLKPAAYGKKQPDGSWKIHLEFRNALTYEVVDNCIMILKKFN